MLGAPVVEREQPVTDLPLAGDRPGDAGAQVQHVAELFFRDPCDGDLLPGCVGVQRLDDLGELFRAQVLEVPGQQVLDAVFGVAGTAALRLPEELARVDALPDDPAFFAPFAPTFTRCWAGRPRRRSGTCG